MQNSGNVCFFTGSFQTAAGFAAPGQLAQGINWASPGCLQSPTMIQPNTQILIRGSHNGEMFFHSPATQPTFQVLSTRIYSNLKIIFV